MNKLPDGLTYCKGDGCLLIEHCLRSKLPTDERKYEVFSDPPFKVTNKDGLSGVNFDCPLFWGVNQMNIFDMLKRITNGEESEANDDKGTDGIQDGNS